MAIQSWSHIGICCSDLDRSTAFYVNVLGFRELFTMDLGPEFAATMEIDGQFTSRMLARPDMRLELVRWTTPDGVGDRERRAMNQFGFTHLAFRVEAIDDLWELAEQYGGTAQRHTVSRMEGAGGSVTGAVYLTDPDGVRIECMAGVPDLSTL
ncbi:VOC family protein [Williamsia sp.]|uniref:VOC family protein n=1 Tax=Williamsia sp. TaxID=1872085 RepID=UPI001A2E4F9F|nr:VOC family protein [Williamsia sp.]MBJ7287357.1 VOC family protein [Williamsia sp.]